MFKILPSVTRHNGTKVIELKEQRKEVSPYSNAALLELFGISPCLRVSVVKGDCLKLLSSFQRFTRLSSIPFAADIYPAGLPAGVTPSSDAHMRAGVV